MEMMCTVVQCRCPTIPATSCLVAWVTKGVGSRAPTGKVLGVVCTPTVMQRGALVTEHRYFPTQQNTTYAEWNHSACAAQDEFAQTLVMAAFRNA